MANLEKGDRVIATEPISVGFIATVDKGTEGVIVEVDTFLFSMPTYRVKWENGDTSNSAEDRQLEALGRQSSADGCALLITASVMISIVACNFGAKWRC